MSGTTEAKCVKCGAICRSPKHRFCFDCFVARTAEQQERRRQRRCAQEDYPADELAEWRDAWEEYTREHGDG